ncbi:MAG TPA: Hsp20/alpha crystallin family protein [Candidatus Dormibacteraeota bacterium]|nr:Hsp20/alpha crystallin family protein [Candidatus Dormibacteraeota bacterium]
MTYDDFFREFDQLFAGMARQARFGGFVPNADAFVAEDGRTLVVEVEIAGVQPERIRVAVEGQRLFIAGRREPTPKARRGTLVLKEIRHGDFAKEIHLPAPIEQADITATYRDGILTISLPIARDRELAPHLHTELRMTIRRMPV